MNDINLNNNKTISKDSFLSQSDLQKSKLNNNFNNSDYNNCCDAISTILNYFGYNCENIPSMKKTPYRVMEYLRETISNENQSLKSLLSGKKIPADRYDGLVCVDNIFFYSLCEHHLTPMNGYATIIYKPNEFIVGIGSICDLVCNAAKKLQIQEKMTQQIADIIDEELKPEGLVVLLEAQQHCIIGSGPKQNNSIMRTIIRRGSLEKESLNYLFPLRKI
ncbi:GTP cyclohydrolase I [Lyticum sinuosum]|uniref:GTP cyclohydrolase I n=1 Tax=Lyticum sinuosum TaxID=1332059 RepID=A0AAE4VKJ7_9RICK|nr:GTP cyclohydrolase I [Lyticum sinuosum]MDZ5761063.1 GTP cyclohydrolase 1 [Lyticum sinuosum]